MFDQGCLIFQQKAQPWAILVLLIDCISGSGGIGFPGPGLAAALRWAGGLPRIFVGDTKTQPVTR